MPLHWTAHLPDIVDHVQFSFSFARDLDLTLSSCVSIIGGNLLSLSLSLSLSHIFYPVLK